MKTVRQYPLIIALIAVLAAGVTFATVRMHASAQSQPPAQTGQQHGNRVFGTIQSVSAGSFVVTGRDGKAYTVKTTAATRVLAPSNAGLRDIKAGDTVRIMAQKADDGSFTAVAVQAVPAGLSYAAPGRGGVRETSSGRVFVSGAVAGVTGTSLSVAASNGSATTVAVPASTKISRLISVPVTSLATGAHVAAMGTLNPDGSLSASTIMVVTGKR
ncbi:MAG TPA: DUF5666 domain-containing protein [bacterium]|nr:DUF5666 domain-containing protein [bacterium]